MVGGAHCGPVPRESFEHCQSDRGSHSVSATEGARSGLQIRRPVIFNGTTRSHRVDDPVRQSCSRVRASRAIVLGSLTSSTLPTTRTLHPRLPSGQKPSAPNSHAVECCARGRRQPGPNVPTVPALASRPQATPSRSSVCTRPHRLGLRAGLADHNDVVLGLNHLAHAAPRQWRSRHSVGGHVRPVGTVGALAPSADGTSSDR